MAERQFFSTASCAAKERLEGWNAFVGKAFPGMLVDGPSAFSAKWESRGIGPVTVARIHSQKAVVHRRRGAGTECASGRTLAHFQISGSAVGYFDHQVGCIRPGDASIERDNGGSYALDISENNIVLLIDFLPDQIGLTVDKPTYELKRSAAVDNLQHYAIALLDEEDMLPVSDRQAADEAIIHVFAEMFAHLLSDDQRPLPLDRDDFSRAAAFIDQRLSDNTLRTGVIADELSLSIRQVQRIFAPLGMTPSQFIYKRRVNLAAYRLRTGPSRGSITDLAMDLGFSDTAHMCRLFRRQIGTSPMRYAARAANGHLW